MLEHYEDIHQPSLYHLGADQIVIQDTGAGFKLLYRRGNVHYCPFYTGGKQKVWKTLNKVYEYAHKVRCDCHPNNRPDGFHVVFPV